MEGTRVIETEVERERDRLGTCLGNGDSHAGRLVAGGEGEGSGIPRFVVALGSDGGNW